MVPTIRFVQLYVLVIVRLARRELVWVNVTAHPTADWIAQQITEAFPWDEAPRYLIRDRDGVYGAVVTRRLRATGIRDKPISAGFTVAKLLCGTTDRHDPAGVRRPPDRAWRGPPASGRCRVHCVLQWLPDTPLTRQRRSVPSSDRARR